MSTGVQEAVTETALPGGRSAASRDDDWLALRWTEVSGATHMGDSPPTAQMQRVALRSRKAAESQLCKAHSGILEGFIEAWAWGAKLRVESSGVGRLDERSVRRTVEHVKRVMTGN